MLKAVAGGGGRGMRAVRDEAEIAEAFARCRSEAAGAFGDGVALRRATDRARAAHRSPDPRRPTRRPRAFRRAGMHDPAPQPEADRGRAEPVADASPARADRRGGDADRAGGRLRQPRHVRVPARREGRGRRRLVRLHRGQSPPAGRAHRDRGGRSASISSQRRSALAAGATSCGSRPRPPLARRGATPSRPASTSKR